MTTGSPWSKLGNFLNLIYTFPITVMVGGLGGWALDRHFGTAPWLLVAGFLLGLGAGFMILYRTVEALGKK
jgi:ATP synthase protein I